MPKKTPSKQAVNFNIAKEMELLEQSIEAIENDDNDIDASIQYLTTAMEKAALIREYLKAAQLQVDELISKNQLPE